MLRILFMLIPILLSANPDAPKASLVETAPLAQGEVKRLQTFVGTLYFNQKSQLASETEGKVTNLYFDSGESVQKGDLLLTLDSAILDKNINAARASLAEAEANYKKSAKDLGRYKTLLADQSIAQSEYDAVLYSTNSLRSRVKALHAQLDASLEQKAKKSIKAPFDGIVAVRNVDLGEWVGVGTVVAEVVNPHIGDITVNIPESFVTAVKTGDAINVTIANKEYNGTVKALIPVGDKNTRTFPLKITLESGDMLYEGMQAVIALPNASYENALLIPRDGVIKRFGQQVIFFNANGMAQMLPVTIVGFFEDKVAIESPMLKPGMQIVIKGNERIFPNQPIQPTNQK